MRKGIKFLATLLVLLLSIHLAVSLIVADSKGINNLSKLEIIQKTQKIQVPFIANRGQIDRNVKFYANTFWGSVFINNDGEIIYSLPKITSNRLGIQSLDNKGESDTFHSPKPDSFKNYGPAKVINLYSTIKNSSPTLGGNQKSIALFLKEEFIGGKTSRIEGEEKSITKVNYFSGNDPSKWESNIFTYEMVNLGEVYKGIELKLKAYGNNVEKLFYVKPGAVPESIQIKLNGANALKVNEKGQLEVETALGIVTFTKPIAYQEIEGKRLEVPVEYILLNAKQNALQLLTSASSTSDSSTINSLTTQPIYGFKIASYDKTKVVIIDPLLSSTYLGGTNEDAGFSIASDSSGNVYLAGFTKGDNLPCNSDFPITSGTFDTSYNGGCYSNTGGDAFITKLNKDLTKLLASTYLGGSGKDSAFSIVIDIDGNIYVSGQTESSDFPTTSNAYDSSYNGGGGDQWKKGEGGDVFVSKLNGDLSKLLASTYLGGSRGDKSSSIAKDKGGNIYLTGVTKSSNFPTTPNAYIQYLIGNTDVYISKLSEDLSRLLASTYLGGSDSDVAYSMSFGLDESIYVAGQTSSSDFPTIPNNYDISYNNGNTDAFVSKLSEDLTKLMASTYLGGSSDDECRSIAIDLNGNAYLTGSTLSSDFPTTSNAYDNSFNGKEDVFVSKLSNDLTKLLASTYLGGSSGDAGYAMTIDSNGNIYLTGTTASSGFPTTSNAYDKSFNGGEDVFVSKLSNDLMKLLASTYLGGAVEDYANFIGMNSNGNIYVTGWTISSDFPTTQKAYDASVGGRLYGDAFVSKFDNTLSVSPPIVMTGPAKILTPNSAKLNGLVNANDSSTKVWFEYGTKKGSYNNTSSTQTIVGSNDTKVSIGISGLSVGTTYYYRIVAQNNVGTMHGNERTFIQEIQSPQSSSIPSLSGRQPQVSTREPYEKSTSSLLNVIQEKQTAIYFVTGHGERQFEDDDRGGISGIANALKRDNCRIAPLDILNTKKIPDDCDVLVVAGPTKAYLTEELNIIRKYLENGGKLLLMLEPAITPNNPTGFKTFMAEYGIVVRDDVVVYNKMNLPLFGIQSVAEIYVGKDEYAEFKITDGLKCTIIFRACSVGSAPPNDQMPYQATVLINAPEGSWGETDNANLRQRKPELNVDVDLQGPVSLAVASQVKELPKSVTQSHPAMANDPNAQPQGARLVVFGDVDFASNEYIENPGNADLFRNSVNWLAKKETQLGISAKEETLEQEQEETNAIEEAKKQQIPSLQEEGSSALKNQNWNAAVQAYKKLLEIAPENYDANTNIGTAYTMLNEFDLSIGHIIKAQQLKPAEYQPYYLMGIAYAKKGDKDRAIDSLRDAIYKGYKDLSVFDLKKDTNFPEDFKQDQRFKGLLGKLEINKLISSVKDVHLFDNHSQSFPYKYDNVWDAVNHTLKDQDEKIIQSDKETGIIVTDTCRWAMSREYYKYYILVEGANDTSTKLQLRLVAHDSVFDEKLRRSVLKPMNSSYANKKVNKFLERVKKVLEKNK